MPRYPPGMLGSIISVIVTAFFTGALARFAVPGPDPYSQAQGVSTPAPGGVEAKAPELLIHTLDDYVSLPDAYAQALVAAFRTGVEDVRIPHDLLTGVLSALELVGATMDDALRLALANDETVPASLPLALLLNFAATQVRPSSVVGPIPTSPFANLTWREKGLAFERIEQADPAIVALIDANAPQPLFDGGSGLLRFVGNAMLVFAPFAGYSEYACSTEAAGARPDDPSAGTSRATCPAARLRPTAGRSSSATRWARCSSSTAASRSPTSRSAPRR